MATVCNYSTDFYNHCDNRQIKKNLLVTYNNNKNKMAIHAQF